MVKALTIKLWRDLWQIRGQSSAIAIVIMSGVATFVMCASTLDALQSTRAEVYADYRFADVFVSLKRAPQRLIRRIAAIPGVRAVETRVVAQIRMELKNFGEPITGRLVSIPDQTEPLMNALYLREGRLPKPKENDEVVLSEPFAERQGLKLGDTVVVIINGHRKKFHVCGIGLSPEYIYSIAPGAMFPDYQRYGILWMNRKPLATAYDMDNAFNNVVLRLTDASSAKDVIERLDRLLKRYGGVGAYQRKDQLSDHFLTQEFRGLQTMAILFPTIFLGVATFLLNVVVTRLINTEREQIAVLKAFGYSNYQVGVHYLELILIIVTLGVFSGVLLGRWLGEGLGNIYMDFFHFPYLNYHISADTIVFALLISFASAIIGTLHSVFRAARLPPAEAMRPEAPARYRVSLVERSGIKHWLSQPTRMIVRHIGRRPVKSLLAVIGIAMAGAIMMMGSFQGDAIDYMLHVQYQLAQREDLTVSFTEPTSRKALNEIRSLPGVEYVEPFRFTPVRLFFKHRSYRTAIQAFDVGNPMHRVFDARLEPVILPDAGIVINDYLAEILGVTVGDVLRVEVLSGRQPESEIPVVAMVQEMLGVSTYMQIDALNRFMKEGNAITGAFLAVDPQYQNDVYRKLQNMPRVAGITITEAAIQSAYDTMGDTILIFTSVITLLASGIAFGVIYNSARIAFSERSRELASLRVLGFSRGEVAYILLGELAILTLAAIPLGFIAGRGICLIFTEHMNSDLYRIPLVLEPASYAFSASVVLVFAIVSGILLWWKITRLDMVAVLKTRE